MDDLRQLIWSRSRIFDLESGGLRETEHPLIEGGVLNLKTGKLRRTAFAYGLREEGRWRKLSQSGFLERLSPWARAKFEPGQPWRPFLTEKRQAPAGWLRRNLAEPVSRGQWLWAHNARFDLRFLAQNLTEAGYEQLAGSLPEELLSAGSRRAGKLHVTAGKETYRLLQQAKKDPWRASRYFVQSWQPFAQTLRQAAKNKQGLLLDTQYVMQAALAHAQEAGLMRPTQDLFTGTSVEAAKVAFQRSYAGPAHTVAPDIRAAAGLLEDYLGLIGSIRGKQALTPRQQRALRFHEELQPRLFPETARLQFLRARSELLQHRPYEYYSAAGVQTYTWNYRSILELYKQRQGLYGYGQDLAGIHREVGGLSLAQVEEQLAGRDARLQQILKEAWEASGQPTYRDFGFAKARRFGTDRLLNRIRSRPFSSFTAGVGTVMLGLSFFSGKDDDYNTIEGLEHGWFGEQRKIHTDFGSGYRDDEVSRDWLDRAWGWAKSHKLMWATIAAASALGVAAKNYNIYGLRGLHAYTTRFSERIAAAAKDRNLVLRYLMQAGADIVRHPATLGLAATAAFVEEGYFNDQPVRSKDVVETAVISTIDLADDVLWLGGAKLLGKISTGERTLGERLAEHAVGRVGGQLFRAAGAGALGFAVGKAGGLVMRWHRQRRQWQQQQTGLVQHLDRNKINHQRMNGY